MNVYAHDHPESGWGRECRYEARGPAQHERSSGEEASMEKPWVSLGVTSTRENMSLGCQPLSVACRRGDWEGMEIWRYGETWAHVHISLVKMLSCCLDLICALIISYLCVSGWRELCEEFPLSGHQVEKNSPKASCHTLGYAIVRL